MLSCFVDDSMVRCTGNPGWSKRMRTINAIISGPISNLYTLSGSLLSTDGPGTGLVIIYVYIMHIFQ